MVVNAPCSILHLYRKPVAGAAVSGGLVLSETGSRTGPGGGRQDHHPSAFSTQMAGSDRVRHQPSDDRTAALPLDCDAGSAAATDHASRRADASIRDGDHGAAGRVGGTFEACQKASRQAQAQNRKRPCAARRQLRFRVSKRGPGSMVADTVRREQTAIGLLPRQIIRYAFNARNNPLNGNLLHKSQSCDREEIT